MKNTLKVQRFNGVAQNGRAAAESFPLRFIKRQRNRGQRAVPTNEVRERERNVIAVRQPGDACANCQDRTLIVQQNVDDARDCAADAVKGRAFPGDDLIRGITDTVVDALPVLFGERFSVNFSEFIQR